MVAHHCGGVHAPDLITPELITSPHADSALPSATETPPIEMALGNDSAAELESEGGAGGHGKADSLDCSPAWFADQPTSAEAKRLSSLCSELALAGWTLTDSPENQHGQFIASRWGLARDLRDLDAVEAFCRHVGATK